MRDQLRHLPDPARGFGPEGFPGQPGRPFVIERSGNVRFGVAVGPVTEEAAEQFDLKEGKGVIVREVVKGTPAEKAGLKKNDVIIRFAGKDVGGDAAKFAEAVSAAKAGEKVDVVIIRKGKQETLKGIELPEAPKRGRVEVRPGGEGGFNFKPGEFKFNPGEFKFDPPNFPREGFQFRVPAEGGKRMKFEQMSVRVSNDEFEIDARKDDVRYKLSGTVADGKVSSSGITITEGKKKSEYKTVNEVPEQHRAAVQQLLGSVAGR
jgi:membrane-associated protease RseP (regulator of RpoE activity)